MKPKVIITIVLGTVIVLLSYINFQNSVPNEIAKMQKDLPMKIDDAMMLTEVYETEKTIFYVIVIDTEMPKAELQISPYDIEEDKQAIIANFRREM